MSKPKLKLLATTEKTPPEKPLVELSKEQLEAIAGGNYSDECQMVSNCGVNHNETMVSAAQLNLEGGTDV